MPDQVIPITDLAAIGLVQDTPSASLPPNAFSNCQNVRFKDGAIRKFPSEAAISLPGTALSNVVYFAYWPAPQGDKYVVVQQVGTNATIRLFNVGTTITETTLTGTNPITGVAAGYKWQHTLFNGGFHIILNNGVTAPVFLQEDSTSVTKLPGWDSYTVNREVSNFEHNGLSGRVIIKNSLLVAPTSGTYLTLKFTKIPRNTATSIATDEARVDSSGNITTRQVNKTTGAVSYISDKTLLNVGTIDSIDFSKNQIEFSPDVSTGGDTFNVTVVTQPATSVTAGVIRSYGNLLVAGNLVERNSSTVLRRLTGTIRTSDVAAPGDIPVNWNPFNLGVNTADEFTLSSTGIIQDMVELQGILYVYTDSSIHSIQQTGNPIVPFQISPVTNSYGAKGLGSVIEVDGKHIVVGSEDIYVFAGHPGSISSIADGRVRHQTFFDRSDVRISRFNKYDELWFWSPSSTTQYIWNYRSNVWTKRVGTAFTIVNPLRNSLIGTTSSSVLNVDGSSFLKTSFVERRRFALAPEFDTESIGSMVVISEGTGSFDITAVGSNTPGDTAKALTSFGSFAIANEYKQDMRLQGRFLNYRITHNTTDNFNISGLQLEISKGGRR